ncbi:2-amino-4-hydroxy-6-hydroxymethyldihydropteridine diphosphokinase [Terasakiella sp. A23]|uniref:2-amino-4-hydroxy-6- hydroxymethyldihydropteridine diphosphokinase n=1 Tax=Terasakiella sp. FCG-A23 TaxID=3080561 RepID=UPI002953BD8C|nr:2-amino-4-hydroxy-6-hydroxymethyldihydropteridine diphosphokinase [Terasakiella sp. A23]MDV7341461.1 2-amino-4-hydroxy-6-hydroxymethyldihydropteridine diphosphokinase [Terasakiella sp. A23]
MIFVGMGANLPSPKHGSPVETLEACLKTFKDHDLKIVKRSNWYKSAPVPMSDQPWYINGVVAVETDKSPRDVLETLLEIENSFGRVRSEVNAPRVLDLDLIAHHDQIIQDEGNIEDKPFCIPHPRMHERSFVLLPLQQLAGNWTHPETQKHINDLIANLPKDQIIEIIP